MNNFFGPLNFPGSYFALNVLFALGFIWSIAWKGFALWRAAHNKQQYWFVAMLILNTFGILEIIYLFRFAKKRLTIKELKSLVTRS